MASSDNKNTLMLATGVTLLVIIVLLPFSFSYVEYYEYGLTRRKTTGKVDTSKVYSRGRYFLGPDKSFIKYQADAHYVSLKEMGVFSASETNSSIGLEFIVDVDFTYFLKPEEVGKIHEEMAGSYKSTIESRIRTAIKNEAIFITFSEYFQSRLIVESRFREAVEEQLNSDPPLHCYLDQFHLGRIRIPESVARKQLESSVQNERNDEEGFLQQAQIERELTKVEVNSIRLEKEKVLRTAQAQASLVRTKAIADSDKLKNEAQINGTAALFQTIGLTSQDLMMAFTYIRTLTDRNNLDLSLGYLSPENILKTTAV